MTELTVGKPGRLSTDLARSSRAEALATLTRHVASDAGARISGSRAGARRRIAPTAISSRRRSSKSHRRRRSPAAKCSALCCMSCGSARGELRALIDALNASGYALTGGVHSRIDGVIDLVRATLGAGNIYVNRNIIGAVVGVQPFGGHGLSGTGPKAGGPLYLKRLLAAAPPLWPQLGEGVGNPAATRFCDWLPAVGREALAGRCAAIVALSRLGASVEPAGPRRREQYLFAASARRRSVPGAIAGERRPADRLRARRRQSRRARRRLSRKISSARFRNPCAPTSFRRMRRRPPPLS